jgi:hypothetical protein
MEASMKILRQINDTLCIYEDEAGVFVAWVTWHKDFDEVLEWREREVEKFKEHMDRSHSGDCT